HNFAGVILACWALKLRGKFSVLQDELVALHERLKIDATYGLCIFEIETDSLKVVSKISTCQLHSPLYTIIVDIRTFLPSGRNDSCHYVLRSRNMVEHLWPLQFLIVMLIKFKLILALFLSFHLY
ncbi:hypothetical protein PanWU01x14_201160, partial [Parasponia andersonii]